MDNVNLDPTRSSEFPTNFDPVPFQRVDTWHASTISHYSKAEQRGGNVCCGCVRRIFSIFFKMLNCLYGFFCKSDWGQKNEPEAVVIEIEPVVMPVDTTPTTQELMSARILKIVKTYLSSQDIKKYKYEQWKVAISFKVWRDGDTSLLLFKMDSSSPENIIQDMMEQIRENLQTLQLGDKERFQIKFLLLSPKKEGDYLMRQWGSSWDESLENTGPKLQNTDLLKKSLSTPIKRPEQSLPSQNAVGALKLYLHCEEQWASDFLI
jgi:hypothetical protein